MTKVTPEMRRDGNEIFYDIYEELVGVLIEIDNSGLTGDPRALRLRDIVARMKSAIDLKDDASMVELCHIIRYSLR